MGKGMFSITIIAYIVERLPLIRMMFFLFVFVFLLLFSFFCTSLQTKSNNALSFAFFDAGSTRLARGMLSHGKV